MSTFEKNALRILVLGARGLLGSAVCEECSKRFVTFGAIRGDPHDRETPGCFTVLGGFEAQRLESLLPIVAEAQPHVIINCVGITHGPALLDPVLSISVNGLFPHQLASLCRAIGARLIHISTDGVFSGRVGRYTEEDEPDPPDFYGRTKLLGEVMEENCLTLRTSFIGPDPYLRRGLFEWFRQQQGTVVKGYTQVIFNGLTTLVLAWVIAEVIQNCSELSGIFHVGSEAISKYELLVCLRDAFNWDIAIEPCKSPRCDRSLDSSRFRHKTGIVVPSWDIMISELVASLGPGTIQNAPNPRENQLSFGQ